jgi:di/tricarboxylate transporter
VISISYQKIYRSQYIPIETITILRLNIMSKYLLVFFLLFSLGCNVSPFSPKQRNPINNRGNIDDIRNNQNGLMLDLANIRSKLDLIARDVENIQQGFMNSNNRNYGIQIFQGEGGLIVGISLISLLLFLVYNYKTKADKYRKTTELLGKEIKEMVNKDKNLKDNLYIMAVHEKIEEDIYKLLNEPPSP